MKKIVFVCLALFVVVQFALAQAPANLSRQVFRRISVNEEMEHGEFQVDLSKAANYTEAVEDSWFSYSYVTKNRFTGKGTVISNGSSLIQNRNMQVKTYRIGPSSAKSIFIIKNKELDNNEMGFDMEIVRAYGFHYPVCDSVVYITDDGYVAALNGAYYYNTYMTRENSSQKFQITWPERKVFENKEKLHFQNNASELSKLAVGDVYYESAEGHYYYLYRDQYMPNTVLVIDGQYVELFDKYTEKDFKLKFSFNGEHWMGVGNGFFWVDGQRKSVEGYTITDFVITNEGHYGYKALRNGKEKEGETVVIDGQLIRRNAHVSYFELDANGRLKFRFVSGDRILQYENVGVADVTNQLESVYYPGCSINDRPVTLLSNDGMHKMTYQKDKQGVEIDGKKLTESVPCYAILDEQSKCFVWNAIEKKDEGIELVIYKYYYRK